MVGELKLYILILAISASLSAQTIMPTVSTVYVWDGNGLAMVTPYMDKEMKVPMMNPLIVGQQPLTFWVQAGSKVTIYPASYPAATAKPIRLPQPPSRRNEWKPAVQVVRLDNWNGVHEMWTPKPSVVFIDEPIERIASRHEGYERLGYKFYRRITK